MQAERHRIYLGAQNRPVETYRQNRFDEIRFEEAALALDRPTVVHQRRESVSRGIHVEGRAHASPKAVPQVPYQPWMNGKTVLSRRQCVDCRNQLEVAGHASLSLDRDPHRKAYGKGV